MNYVILLDTHCHVLTNIKTAFWYDPINAVRTIFTYFYFPPNGDIKNRFLSILTIF